MRHDESRVLGAHREGAGHDHHTRHVAQPSPARRRLATSGRRAARRPPLAAPRWPATSPCLPCEPLQLPFAPRMAEDGSELPAHQPGTEDADPQGGPPSTGRIPFALVANRVSPSGSSSRGDHECSLPTLNGDQLSAALCLSGSWCRSSSTRFTAHSRIVARAHTNWFMHVPAEQRPFPRCGSTRSR
jgi:hypothetical protein